MTSTSAPRVNPNSAAAIGLAHRVGAVEQQQRRARDRNQIGAGADDATGEAVQQQAHPESARDREHAHQGGGTGGGQRFGSGIPQNRHQMHHHSQRGEREQSGGQQ